MRKTSSTPTFDFKGRVPSGPSGGLAAQCIREASTLQISAMAFISDGTPLLLLLLPLMELLPRTMI